MIRFAQPCDAEFKTTRSFATADGPQDALSVEIFQLLQNYSNKLLDKSTTDQSGGVIKLQLANVK